MIIALFIAGIISIIGGIIIGLGIGTFWGITVAIIGGIATSCIFFGLANVLQNQEVIIDKVQGLADFNRKKIGEKVCLKCGKLHEEDMSSCPHCGYREK